MIAQENIARQAALQSQVTEENKLAEAYDDEDVD